jgi:hypothetical protein
MKHRTPTTKLTKPQAVILAMDILVKWPISALFINDSAMPKNCPLQSKITLLHMYLGQKQGW